MANSKELQERRYAGVNAAIAMLGQGLIRRRVVEQLVADYGVGQTQAYDWYNEACLEMVPKNEQERQELRADVATSLRVILNKAMAAKDYPLALQAIDRKVKMFALADEPQGSVTNNMHISVSLEGKTEARRKRIQELIEEAVANGQDPFQIGDDG